MNLLWFCLAAYGITQIIVYGSIFNSIRPPKTWLKGLGELFHCPMCMGFWVGLFLFGINRYTELFTFEYTFANALICGGIASAAAYMLNMVFSDDGIQIGVNNGN